MKKNLFLTLFCLAMLGVSCERDNSEVETVNSFQELGEEGESVLILIPKRMSNSLSNTGEGEYNEKENFVTGGNCYMTAGTCPNTGLVMPNGNLQHNRYDEVPEYGIIKPILSVDEAKFPENIQYYENLKEDYITTHLKDIKINLSGLDLKEFKESMVLDKNLRLVSWDMSLLRKGMQNNFEKAIKNIGFDLMKRDVLIVIVDPDTNKEEYIK